ncbi:hypothetical protein H0H81_002548 [Sphagnurus paluster]|uniref:Uncharacterized protein n=1 Tax=Sphagnurus paluster TaxID=117069 RepID=A0A9P7KEY8_9AGAR|nr:hypothetical protein H0H81_002548 [Sphagnurus paluster]
MAHTRPTAIDRVRIVTEVIQRLPSCLPAIFIILVADESTVDVMIYRSIKIASPQPCAAPSSLKLEPHFRQLTFYMQVLRTLLFTVAIGALQSSAAPAAGSLDLRAAQCSNLLPGITTALSEARTIVVRDVAAQERRGAGPSVYAILVVVEAQLQAVAQSMGKHDDQKAKTDIDAGAMAALVANVQDIVADAVGALKGGSPSLDKGDLAGARGDLRQVLRNIVVSICGVVAGAIDLVGAPSMQPPLVKIRRVFSNAVDS